MLIKRDFCKLIDDSRIVEQLKVKHTDECVYDSSDDKLVFMAGTKIRGAKEWRELYKCHKTEGVLNAYRYQYRPDYVFNGGYYVYDNEIELSDIVVFNIDNVILLSEGVEWPVFMMSGESEVEFYSVRMSPKDLNYRYRESKKISLTMEENEKVALYEEFGEGRKHLKRLRSELKGCSTVACSPETGMLVTRENRFITEKVMDRLLVYVGCSNEMQEIVDITEVVSIHKKAGYIYFEPIHLEFDAKLSVIGNRKFDIEYFDYEDTRWKMLNDINEINKINKTRDIELRVSMEFGDCIYGAYIMREE